jgi:integrase
VAVVETVVRGRGGKVGFGAPKSEAGRRTLALPVELVDMLEAHMAEKALTAADGDALLFTAPDGGVLRYSNWLRRVWHPACVAAGLGRMVEDETSGRSRYEGLGFHDLRRANATGLVVEGVDVKTAQGLLGHSTPALTLDLYAQQVNLAMVRAANAMGARFLEQSPRDGRAMESGDAAESEAG